MVNPQDHNLAYVRPDSVEHAVGAAAGRPDAREVATQRRADALWVVEECSGDELDDGGSNRFW